jgi:hypothetical protein
MNSENTIATTETTAPVVANNPEMNQIQMKYRTVLNNANNGELEANVSEQIKDMATLEELLDKEQQHNKTKTWNKLDKTQKIQKLHAYAEKYSKEHGLPVKEMKTLKMYFIQCLDEQKLLKTKEVIYNKDSREIINIPGLGFNMITHTFYIKNMDPKHVSTIKSLTPKRISEKNMESK